MNNIVVNFFGGPGSGKTTAAAKLFASLKHHDVDSILVGEFAQECILAGDSNALKDQLWILANSHRRIRAAYQNSRVTIVDSPMLLSVMYAVIYEIEMPFSFKELVLNLNNQFQNINILIERSGSSNHSMVGRVHSLSESIGIDRKVESLLVTNEIPFIRESEVAGDLTDFLTQQILEYLADES
jgi:nicotinamide riboside kinase